MNLSPLPIQKFFDNNGRPLTGGLLFTYTAGTTTKVATYSDEAGTPNTNPVVLNFRGEASVWLDQTLTYKFVLAPEGDTDPPTRPIWTVDDISAAVTYASLTQQILGRILFPRTPGEIAAAITPTDYGFRAIPISEAIRYGFSTSASAAANAAAIVAAIDALPQTAGAPGGTVVLPGGIFNCNEIVIPERVIVAGVGRRSTQINYSGPNFWATLGSGSGALKYGCGLTDMAIICTDDGGSAVNLIETCNADVSRLYIEGTLNVGRTNIGVQIDGMAVVSSFFNNLNSIQCNHVQTGFLLTGTAPNATTQNLIINCDVLGDVGSVGAASVGIRVRSGGSGSIVVGGNMEACGIGIRHENGSQSMSVHGTRFEGNTSDVTCDGGSPAVSYFGCQLSIITDNTGDYRNSFIGCVNGSNQPVGTRLGGPNLFGAFATTDIPLRGVGALGQSVAILQVENSSLVQKFQVGPSGEIGFFGTSMIAKQTVTGSRGGNVALASLLTALAAYGLIVDSSS